MIALLQINYSQDHSEVTLPLGILSVGSALKKAGFEVKLFNITEKEITRTAREIANLEPEFLGVSVMTGIQTRHSAQLCKEIKILNKKLPIVWGGIHPSLLPKQCLGEDYIDMIVVGEGEITAVLLAQKISSGNLGGILGLGYKEGKELVLNKERPFIENLDEYRLDFSLVNVEKYLFRLKGCERAIAYKGSRGCSFDCGFCYNRLFNKGRWRAWSADVVIQDINFLKEKYNIDAVKFYDDNFFINRKRAIDILTAIDLPTHTEIRIDMITDELAKKLKNLKVAEFLIGIESGSNRILELINKGYTVDKIKEGVKILAKYDLFTAYSTIVGLPTETKEEFEKTLDLMYWVRKTHPRSGFTMGAYLPYPGSLMYESSIKQGFRPPEKTENWGDIDRFRKSFSSPWVNSKRVWKIREYFKFFNYKISLLDRWLEFRIKNRFFGFSWDIYLIEYLAGLAIKEKGFFGKILRWIHGLTRNTKNLVKIKQ